MDESENKVLALVHAGFAVADAGIGFGTRTASIATTANFPRRQST
jgi:hypothetical protein